MTMSIEKAREILASHGARSIEVALSDNPDGPVQEITSRHACGVEYDVVIGDASYGDRGQARTVWSKSVTFGATDRTVAGGHDFVMAAREQEAVALACLALIDHGVKS